MNSRNEKALVAIFESPTRANVLWSDIESLLLALGGELTEGSGSRVRVALSGRRAVFHRPHPGKQAKRYQVEDMREFLRSVGVTP